MYNIGARDSRTGYLIPGCVGIPGLALAQNSSVVAAVAVVVVALRKCGKIQ